MILLDWTRMGRSYCLAGAVWEDNAWRIVRPLLLKFRDAPTHKVGWSAYLLDGHARWELFELVGPSLTPVEPPHVEDLWVRALNPRRRSAAPAQRREVLAATLAAPDEPFFGAPFEPTRAVGLRPGAGQRSLVTVLVAGREVAFTGSYRDGPEPDVRVTLPLPGLGERSLPLKDHHLLARAEAAATTLEGRLQALTHAVHQMGEQVAVRLGLSRAFPPEGHGTGLCWLMADGFFSFTDPQP